MLMQGGGGHRGGGFEPKLYMAPLDHAGIRDASLPELKRRIATDLRLAPEQVCEYLVATIATVHPTPPTPPHAFPRSLLCFALLCFARLCSALLFSSMLSEVVKFFTKIQLQAHLCPVSSSSSSSPGA